MKISAAALALAVSIASGQTDPGSGFEVASIRKHGTELRRIGVYSVSGRRLTLEAYDIRLLIMEAYDLKNYQVSLPPVSGDVPEFYDITATAPDGPAPGHEEFRRMLRALLADRFQLKIHQEERELPVYALVVDKKGPALKASEGDGRCAARIGPEHPVDRLYRYQYSNCTLEPLVNTLQAERPVVDRTGLTGKFDITLIATPAFKMRDASEPGDISLEDSIRQLGLRLEPRKEKVPVSVIDHIGRPTDN